MDAKPARGKPLMLNKAALPFLLVLAGGWSGVAFASSTSRPPVYWSVAPEDRQERDPALFRSVMLRAHNAARREAGQQPLRWNERLAADALRYASELARTRRFQHSREPRGATPRSEEHTSELQSLMRISYAVFCLKKKKHDKKTKAHT